MVSVRWLWIFRILVVMVLGLMALGAGVRTMGAGLACPDWPLCFGQVIPDFHVGVYFEFIHRAYAGLVALVFVSGLVYLQRWPQAPRMARRLSWVALLILLLQIVMGGLTVLKLLKAHIVTSHLALATLFFASLLWILFSLEDTRCSPSANKVPTVLKRIAGFLPVLVFIQILLGGAVASSYAGMVCVDFPLCNGQWVPTLSGPIGLQVLHRFGAYFVAAYVLGVFLFMQSNRSRAWAQGGLLKWSTILMILVLTQIGLGVANLFLFIPPWLAVLHQFTAMLILGSSLRMTWLAGRAPREIF